MEKREISDKYLYVRNQSGEGFSWRNKPWQVRLVGFLALLSLIFVVYGFYRFFSLSFWYWIIFGPIAFLFILNRLIRFINFAFYPGFDLEKHLYKTELYWLKNSEPSVDVFLPVAGEELDVLEQTWDGVKNLDYKNYKVYVLDDKGDEQVEAMAKRYGFKYLSRPNKGEYKKAGNLIYGYENSDGEFVLVLDADFVPHKDFLRETIPYMQDEKIGIVQTPQYFETSDRVHERSSIEYGGGNVVENFYKFDLLSRNSFGAAMCVGTSALYRRKAVLEAGGPPKVWDTEDVRQGLLITQKGYRVWYLPIILSIGLSPDTPDRYFKQHNRWCFGSLGMYTESYYWKAKIPFFARFIYLVNPTHYLSEGLSPLFNIHLPILLLLHYDTLHWTNFLWFLPYIIMDRIILRSTKTKLGTSIAAYNNIFTYLYTIINNILLKFEKLNWEPAGLKQSKLSSGYLKMVFLAFIMMTIHLVLYVYSLFSVPSIHLDEDLLPVVLWSAYNISFYILFVGYSFSFIYKHYLNSNLLTGTSLNYYLNFQRAVPVIVLFVLLGTLGFNFYRYWNFRGSNVVSNGIVALNNGSSEGNLARDSQETGSTPTGTISEEGVSAINMPEDVLGISVNDTSERESKEVNDNPTPGLESAEGGTKKYVYVANPGDSQTLLVRRSMNDYLEKQKITLSPEQKLYVETNITYKLGAKMLMVGEVVEVEEKDLREYVTSANNLTDEQILLWRQYLN